MAEITKEQWANCVKHVVDKVEPAYWRKDGLLDTTVPPVIIHLGDEESSEDEEDVEDTEEWEEM